MVAVKAAQAGNFPACCSSQFKPMFDTYKCWLGRQDSNLGCRYQKPEPYHLATPQHDVGKVL